MLRLAELLSAVSLATDLAHGVPFESALCDCLLALQLARLAGLDGEDLSDAYYLALLYHLGCTGAAEANARVGAGDDVNVRRWISEADYTSKAEMMRIAITKLGKGAGPVSRARALVAFMSANETDFAGVAAGVCEVAARLSQRLGASARVTAALDEAFARWDGKVFSGLPKGEALSRLARIVHLSHVAQIYYQAGGSEAADAVVRGRSGTEFDPELARLWLDNSADIAAALTGESVWERVLAAEPHPQRLVPQSHLDEVTAAFADFVDLKSPYTLGHSSRLAQLVEQSGAALALPKEEVTAMRRAAQVHDLGNVSVPTGVFMKSGTLNRAEWDRVRLHPYHSQRVLAVAEPLKEAGELAGMHHERLDASGYHRGLPASAIPLPARVLAAAEVYQSMTEERSWRPALTSAQAATELRQEAREGKLDRRATDAVLEAAGHPPDRRREARGWPAGLTDREVDVLRMLARGRSNKEIARELHVSEATVHTHVINLYGKIQVNSRAGAVLYALEHDLIQL